MNNAAHRIATLSLLEKLILASRGEAVPGAAPDHTAPCAAGEACAGQPSTGAARIGHVVATRSGGRIEGRRWAAQSSYHHTQTNPCA